MGRVATEQSFDIEVYEYATVVGGDDEVEGENAALPYRGCDFSGAENTVQTVVAAAIGANFVVYAMMIGRSRVDTSKFCNYRIHA
jgi:hypothetical protein